MYLSCIIDTTKQIIYLQSYVFYALSILTTTQIIPPL